jgi:nucleotide-binding universal stress UspA family protein
MKLLQNILVPVDFRKSSINAFLYAAKVSELFHSKLIILHVIREESLSAETEQMLRETVWQKYQEMRGLVDAAVSDRMEFTVEKGVIFERIIHAAIQREINVIIAGSGSDTEEGRFPLSTTIEKLMRKNQVPLWVVRNPDQLPVHNILCPVDFSDASERALNNAITLASRLESKLSVMNVFTPLNIHSPRLSVDADNENEILKKKQFNEFKKFLSGFDLRSVRYEKLFLVGVPEDQIGAAIEKDKIDLLIMGTTGRTGLSRILMGSVTEKVTREVPCSFITTKSKDITRTSPAGKLGEIETYMIVAKQHREAGDYEKAIEYYSAGLHQYPDNIPILIGLMNTHKDLGNETKAAFFRDYARDVVTRVWGEEYINKLGLE